MAAMMGIASEVDAVYNYHVDNPRPPPPSTRGTLTRHWATDTYSLFFQDTWHARAEPNGNLRLQLSADDSYH